MEILIFPTLVFVLIALIGYKQSRGFMSLPTVCLMYLTCIYIGGLRLWLQEYSDTYLYVLVALVSYVLGMTIVRNRRRPRSDVVASKETDERSRSGTIASKRASFYSGLHPKILTYTLSILTLMSLSVWAYWLWTTGVPLFSGDPSNGWVNSGAGAVNRLLASLGGENLIFMGLGWYALYKTRKDRLYLSLAAGCAVAGALFSAFQGSKGSAVMTVLWFSIALFYFNRRTPKLKTFVVMALFAIPVTYWATSYYVNRPGMNPASMVYDRLTTGELGGLNFLTQTWVPRYGHAGTKPFSMDVERIKAQFFGGSRPVVFHEYIWNLIHGVHAYDSFRLSESLTLFGMGYACFGWAGGILFMLIFGGICEVLDNYLMTRKKIHFILFAIWIYSINGLVGILMSGDILIIGIEAMSIMLIPKLFAFVVVYVFLALPFGISLKWRGGEASRHGAPGGREVPATITGNYPGHS
jgi:hypothetical protein